MNEGLPGTDGDGVHSEGHNRTGGLPSPLAYTDSIQLLNRYIEHPPESGVESRLLCVGLRSGNWDWESLV